MSTKVEILFITVFKVRQFFTTFEFSEFSDCFSDFEISRAFSLFTFSVLTPAHFTDFLAIVSVYLYGIKM